MNTFVCLAAGGLGGCAVLWSYDLASRKRWVRAVGLVLLAGCLVGEATARYQAARRQARQADETQPNHAASPN